MKTLPQYINGERGFLPAEDPCRQLPAAFAQWESFAAAMPKLLLGNQFRAMCRELPPFPHSQLTDPSDVERAMLLVSFIGHAYVWGCGSVVDHLPENLALAWWHIAEKLQRPPVLSYASYALHNWHRLDKQKPIALGNIALNQNFLGGQDEEWFVLVHIDIEAKAGPMLQALIAALYAVDALDIPAVANALQQVAEELTKICAVLDRMPERCDPYIYFQRVRPYIHGWNDNPALPKGLVYTGVAAYGERGQFFRGETGAQSGIVPALDAALKIEHASDPLRTYLQEMRLYMPKPHRAFIEALEAHTGVRSIIEQSRNAAAKAAYNSCILLLDRFRQTHLKYASEYIHKQSQTSLANPNTTGTGGTPFMKYLKKHENETLKHVLK